MKNILIRSINDARQSIDQRNLLRNFSAGANRFNQPNRYRINRLNEYRQMVILTGYHYGRSTSKLDIFNRFACALYTIAAIGTVVSARTFYTLRSKPFHLNISSINPIFALCTGITCTALSIIFLNSDIRKLAQIEQGLQKWVSQAPLEEKNNRITCAFRILQSFIEKAIYLDLSKLGLTSLPSEIGYLTHLHTLLLEDNRLRSLPLEINSLSNLDWLDLSNNKLTSLPSIDNLVNLRGLSLKHNRLRSLSPEIASLHNLRELQLQDNQLLDLPNELIPLLEQAYILIENNPLSGNTIDRITQHKKGQSAIPLSTRMSNLCKAAKQKPLQLVHLKDNQHLCNWLAKLDFMRDYHDQAKKLILSQLIYDAIAEAELNETYRDVFLTHMIEAGISCGDRVALVTLRLGIELEIIKCMKDNNLKHLIYLLGHGNWALDQLGDIALNKILALRRELGNAEKVEEVEVYLIYPVELKKALSLPIAIDSMIFASSSKVTKEELDYAKTIVHANLSNLDAYCTYLATNPQWLSVLAKERADTYGKLQAEKDLEIGKLSLEQEDIAYESFKTKVAALTKEVLQDVGLPPFC